MSIVSSLSKLLTKMGGQPKAGDNSDELIEKIADKYTPGGGGGNVLIINATIDREHAESETEFPLILDKTAEEIQAAESTVLHVDADGIVIVLQEFYVSPEGSMISYQATIGGMEYQAMIGIEEGALVSFITAHPAKIGLPSVTSSDNGKALKVVDGEWEAVNGTFIVTCTPTNPDMSGTVDKTPAEIYSAYQAGREIIVRLIMGSGEYNEIRPIVHVDNESEIVTLAAYAIDGDDQTGYYLVRFATSTGGNAYETTLFPLTPASP